MTDTNPSTSNTKAAPRPKPKAKPTVADYQVSILGGGSQKVGGKTIKPGDHVKASDLKLDKDGLDGLHKNPYLTVEPIDKDGNVLPKDAGE